VSLLIISAPPKYKLLILEKVEFATVVSRFILELVDLENFFILSKALVSLDIEFPIEEKSILPKEEFASFGDKTRWLGKLT
jgi:hypothetical protein